MCDCKICVVLGCVRVCVCACAALCVCVWSFAVCTVRGQGEVTGFIDMGPSEWELEEWQFPISHRSDCHS